MIRLRTEQILLTKYGIISINLVGVKMELSNKMIIDFVFINLDLTIYACGRLTNGLAKNTGQISWNS